MDVHVEQGDLGGADLAFNPYKGRIRLVYDARQVAEGQAIDLLRLHLPNLDGVKVLRQPAM